MGRTCVGCSRLDVGPCGLWSVCARAQVVQEWALGTPFVDICSLTDVMEGSIVRAVVRLDQACRELQVRAGSGVSDRPGR